MSPIVTHKLRNDISVLEGSGGNIAVLTGPDGKLLIDAGIGVHCKQFSMPRFGVHRNFSEFKNKEKPQPGSGGTGAGASIFRDGYATKVLALRTVPAAVCFRYHLGRGCEADVG